MWVTTCRKRKLSSSDSVVFDAWTNSSDVRAAELRRVYRTEARTGGGHGWAPGQQRGADINTIIMTSLNVIMSVRLGIRQVKPSTLQLHHTSGQVNVGQQVDGGGDRSIFMD